MEPSACTRRGGKRKSLIQRFESSSFIFSIFALLLHFYVNDFNWRFSLKIMQ